MSDHINGPVLAASLDELRYLVFRGMTGATGQSAYELAVSLGFEGTEAEWIASLHGTDGRDGSNGHSLRVNSSGHVEYYNDETQQWVDTGIEVEGVPGPQGPQGPQGPAGADGVGVPSTVVAQAGQVLTLDSGKNPVWQSPSKELPGGGTAGQVLKKTASGVEWANESGGSGAFVIPVTSSTSGGVTTYAVDSAVTSTDIFDHRENMVLVLDDRTVYKFAGGNDSGPLYFAYNFAVQEPGSGKVETEWLKLAAGNGNLSVTPYSMDLAPLPTVTASDNGKFLRVVSGVWAAASVPSAESNSFGGGA